MDPRIFELERREERLRRALGRWKLATAAAALVALALGGLATSFYLAQEPAPLPAPPPPPPPPDRLDLAPAAFADLPGWSEDRLSAAVPAFVRSCNALAGSLAAKPPGSLAGTAADWRPLCQQAARLPAGDEKAARAFFEGAFAPWSASNHGEAEGLFTGYYEPTLAGSRKRGGRFQTPLYLRPKDLVSADLGRFHPELAGKKIAGRLAGSQLEPYADRAAIARGAIAGRGLELVWVDDAIDGFFLEIQGSGRVELAEGGVLRVGYAAGNGQPYFAIGKELIDRGALKKEEVSMQSIRGWLVAHPGELRAVLDKNPNVVFFRRLEGSGNQGPLGAPGPLGAQGLPLSPGRSLAVDTSFWPLGLPLWLDASAPSPDPTAPDQTVRRLLLGQDTGGAIRGPVRGDVFWGDGKEAGEIAGRMKHRGRLWVLLPKRVRPAP